jgi:hypothetical protein
VVSSIESVGIVGSDFVHMDYGEAIQVLERANEKFEFPVKWGIDLLSEHERYLTEKYAKKRVIVMNYPKAIKAFYTHLNDDGRTVAARAATERRPTPASARLSPRAPSPTSPAWPTSAARSASREPPATRGIDPSRRRSSFYLSSRVTAQAAPVRLNC